MSTFSTPVTAWRSQALQSASAWASYYNLGAFSQSSRSGITRASFHYKDVLPVLNAWLRCKFPGHSWSSICVNHNEAMSMHRDLNNAEGSMNLTITLGNFSEGGLFVEAPDGTMERCCAAAGVMIKGCVHNTKAWPLAFNGFLWHASEPWQGDRWSITGYTCRGLDAFPEHDLNWLRSIGFFYCIPNSQTLLWATVCTQICFSRHAHLLGLLHWVLLKQDLMLLWIAAISACWSMLKSVAPCSQPLLQPTFHMFAFQPMKRAAVGSLLPAGSH